MTLEELQKLVEENDIGRPQDIRDKFGESFYQREVVRTRYCEKLKYLRQFENWDLQDFQKFIDKNKVQSPLDFFTRFAKTYRGLINKRQKGWAGSLMYPNKSGKTKLDENFVKEKIIEKCNKEDYIFLNESTWKYGNALTSNIKLMCEKHNHSWETSYNSFVKSNHLCSLCMVKRTKMEDEITDLLKSNKIDFINQYNNPILNGKSLDFYLKDYNIAIECQGEQHFFPIDYFGGEIGFKKQCDRDIKKFDECKSAGIKVLYYVNLKYIKFNFREEIKNICDNSKYFQKIFTDSNELLNEILKIDKDKN